ncbi:hypothetical protein HPB47_006693 [Ixodes persulcatus]|uniref:Uncharacterized protein n=1 Tax=Ixodes persulcatus TaxID=34615 RepID=A0AC60P9L2_IXOPE|nr:hypothetical protein HPB47_006693 [Ixodes persulcatus]
MSKAEKRVRPEVTVKSFENCCIANCFDGFKDDDQWDTEGSVRGKRGLEQWHKGPAFERQRVLEVSMLLDYSVPFVWFLELESFATCEKI